MLYGVILADPPWDYNNAGCRGAAAREYPTMPLEQLQALPIASLAAPDCVLLMWATWPQLERACLPLLKSWGFQYVTGFPWIKIKEIQSDLWGDVKFKTQMGVGYWARGVTELLLIGKRGNAGHPDTTFVGLLSPNLYHSRKPDSIYQYAEAMPGPYLELFARRPRQGWDVWGNEVNSTVQIATPYLTPDRNAV